MSAARDKLLKFWADNPDEELTSSDVGLKLGAASTRSHKELLLLLMAEGLVKRRSDVVDGRRMYVYSYAPWKYDPWTAEEIKPR